MEGKRFIKSIQLRNLLSYGWKGCQIDLEPLNVLVGPNASGKSNLIEALSLLSALPRDVAEAIRGGGGVSEWLWKGLPGQGWMPANVSVSVSLMPLFDDDGHYSFSFGSVGSRLEVLEESLMTSGRDENLVPRLYKDQSIFSRLRDPEGYPEITLLGYQLERIHLFRGWDLGRKSSIRVPQQTDLPEDFLLEDASNLALVLNDFENRPGMKKFLIERLQSFYPRVETFTVKVQGGTVQLFFHEQGLSRPVPAGRFSDGTLQYLCLLAVLCHPDPPPLICIEEPENGLHPDIISELAKLLLEASKRTQLVVTTHSDTLVSALSEVPEAVVVCERGEEGTQLRRLEPDKLKEWLERYRLGELWLMGEIGGTRW